MIQSEWFNDWVFLFKKKYMRSCVYLLTETALYIIYIWFFLQYRMKNIVNKQCRHFPKESSKKLYQVYCLAIILDKSWKSGFALVSKHKWNPIHPHQTGSDSSLRSSLILKRKTKLQPDMNKQMQTNMTNQKGSRWRNKTRRLTVGVRLSSYLEEVIFQTFWFLLSF